MADKVPTKLTLADIKKGSNEDGDCGNSPNIKPHWLDMDKFHRGQQFFAKHIMPVTTSMHFSLVPGFTIINLLVPLVFTNNSHTPEKAFKRYAQTFYHLLKWCTDPFIWDGETSEAFRSVGIVRKMHSNVAKAMDKKLGDNKYISQYDMGLVQSGFMGAIVMYPEKFGVSCTTTELEDYVHLWRGLGYLLGIEDRYNICCGNFSDTYNIVKEIEQQLLIPALQDPPKDFQRMADAYVDGLNQEAGFPASSVSSIIALSYDGMGIPSPPLSWPDMIRFYWLKTLMFLIRWVPFVEQFFNKRTMGSIDGLMEKLFGTRESFMKSYNEY